MGPGKPGKAEEPFDLGSCRGTEYNFLIRCKQEVNFELFA